MGKVITALSMSLDGFIAGPNDEVDQLFRWYFSGDTAFSYPGTDMVFTVSRASVALMQEASRTTGAIMYGRRTFDVAGAWGGTPPLGVPCFIVTHTIPSEWVYSGSPFTFVTDGVASAVAQAQAVAGNENIAIGSATTTQQCLQAGLLDELHIDLVPVLLGAGVRLFDQLGTEHIELERTRVVEGTGVTHLQFRVVKEQ
jgi:dihydrofolate reductase